MLNIAVVLQESSYMKGLLASFSTANVIATMWIVGIDMLLRQLRICVPWANVYGRNFCSYVQGQSPGSDSRVREYFYYVDHHGQLFLDDARMKNFTSCLKDKETLAFFFKRLRVNDTDRYVKSFPFVSLCGRERNFLRCEDLPIVYTEVLDVGGEQRFVFCNGGVKLSVPFNPADICMQPTNGRIYYPAEKRLGGIGLVKSALAIEFSKLFEFRDGANAPPTHILWNSNVVQLNNNLFRLLPEIKS